MEILSVAGGVARFERNVTLQGPKWFLCGDQKRKGGEPEGSPPDPVVRATRA